MKVHKSACMNLQILYSNNILLIETIWSTSGWDGSCDTILHLTFKKTISKIQNESTVLKISFLSQLCSHFDSHTMKCYDHSWNWLFHKKVSIISYLLDAGILDFSLIKRFFATLFVMEKNSVLFIRKSMKCTEWLHFFYMIISQL